MSDSNQKIISFPLDEWDELGIYHYQKPRLDKKSCSFKEFLILKEACSTTACVTFLQELTENIKMPTAFTTYMALWRLCDKANTNKYTLSISYREIANLINSSPRTAMRALKYLKQNGYVDIIKIGNNREGYSANKVRVRFPKHLFNIIMQSGEF